MSYLCGKLRGMETAAREQIDLHLVAPSIAEVPGILEAIERVAAQGPALSDDAADLLRRLGCPTLSAS